MIQNKKAMSGVISILIIISLALVAIGIVWYVIQGIMGTTGIETDQSLDDIYDVCPTDDITDETDSGSVCLETEEVRIVGGEYCCVALPA